jgi:nicotinate-nucleotide adenylyltransferase
MAISANNSAHKSSPLDFGSIRVRPPLVMPGQCVGLLGGSFNPAHEGHLQISQFALKRLQLDRVWWLVSPGNPLKSRVELNDQTQRLADAGNMAARDRRITVTGFEAGLPSAFTAATLSFLQRRHPATRFIWLMGADNLEQFHRWRDWRGILDHMPVAVIDRPGWRLRGLSSKAAVCYRDQFVPAQYCRLLPGMAAPAWTFLTAPLSPLSSTALRAARRAAISPHLAP